jgi:hypothetical protein
MPKARAKPPGSRVSEFGIRYSFGFRASSFGFEDLIYLPLVMNGLRAYVFTNNHELPASNCASGFYSPGALGGCCDHCDPGGVVAAHPGQG